jgi:hypothetical protein
MPNVPMPLVACASSGVAHITTPVMMQRAMIGALRFGSNEQTAALFDAIATVLALGFTTWLSTQQVMMVLGSGSVNAPMGPVAGINAPTPGHLVS